MKRVLMVAAICMILLGNVSAKVKSDSLLRNGGFETDAGWSLPSGASYDTQHKRSGQRSLRVDSSQGVQTEQIVYAVLPGEKLTVCGWLATENVLPASGGGYAFMAIYQFDAAGRMVSAHDFVQVAGTRSWTYASYTFDVHVHAEYLAVRIGIYNASGTAWFDDINLVKGEKAVEWTEPATNIRRQGYRAAILHEPTMPVKGKATPLETFKRVMAEEKIPLTPLNASQLADPQTFNADRFDLLIVPTGASFPVEARKSLQAFLMQGGDLLCTGGYAFDHLLMRRNGKWVPYAQFIKEQMARARDPHFARVPDGGLEEGGIGWEADQHEQCRIVAEGAYAGERCGTVTASSVQSGARFSYTLPVKPGGVYLVGAHARTENVQGPGFAFLAVYQYDREDKLAAFKDFAQIRGTQGWKRYEERFEIAPNAEKVVFHAGLYLASGRMWFDEVTCAPVPREERINAHYGKPEDGLVITPTQLTLFSPDQPISGKRLVAAEGGPVAGSWRSEGEVQGYEATAQLRQSARWLPLVAVRDEYGRFAGVAGALVRHFAGAFTDSTWAIFGVTSRDIFAGAQGEALLRRVLKVLRAGVFAESLHCDYATYRQGEVAKIALDVRNSSSAQQAVRLVWRLLSPDGVVLQERQDRLEVAPREKASTGWTWTVPQNAPDFVVVRLEVRQGDMVLDRVESSFCVEDAETLRNGVRISYEDNAFTLTPPNGSPLRVLLLGTDTYGNWFWSRTHNPLTWFREIRLMRDYGLHMYENLQFHPQGYQFTEAQWRQLDAVVQISQRFSLPYMAGLLIGQDVVVDDATLQQQAEMCRQFAARYKHVPGLIYYLNGDFQLNLKDIPDIRLLWNQFLRERYGTDEALRQAWAPHVPEANLGEILVQNAVSGSWYEVRTRDVREFQTLLMRRWISALCEAIRREDAVHPITSEYYQRPFNGIDLRLTIDGMDASNIGYFGPPQQDLAQIMATVKWNDMRFAGKTVNLGEFGVKTHDAWKQELGGTHYHIRRTEWQQRQLFWWVVHVALALDVTKIQNWCWTDDPDSVFPWGIAWNNPLRPKPVLKLYRNLRLFSDRVPREYRRADVVLVTPDNWRLGAPEGLAHSSLMNAMECLLATGVAFDVANESDLNALAKNPPRVVLMPLAYTLSEEGVKALLALAQSGCMVYLSGDPSTDPMGRRQAERLERLCGVRLQGVGEHASGLPQPNVESAGADLVSTPSDVPLYRFSTGRGAVWYTPVPWETLPGRDVFVQDVALTASRADNLYLSLLPLLGADAPVKVEASEGVWRATLTGNETMQLVSLFPRGVSSDVAMVRLRTGDVQIEAEASGALPCAVLLDRSREPVAATGGGTMRVNDRLVAQGESAWMLVSVDGKPLRQSQMLALTSMDGGKLRWRSEAKGLSAWIVDWHDGVAQTVARVPLRKTADGWEVSSKSVELILVCPENALPSALREISFAVNTSLTQRR
ncbi:MAG: beta-galactosidase [Chthonomonadetes bacterium]|nr:beta-galactosidase [Chthonomonadetes bacterium]